MADNGSLLTDRTVIVGVLISVVAVGLCAAILVVALASVSVKQEVRLVAIVPSPQVIRLDAPGDSGALTVRGYYSDRTVAGLDDGSGAVVSYVSSDPSVARVDSDGVVTGIQAGGVNIFVNYGNLNAAVPVFVWGQMTSVPPFDPDRLLEVADDGSAVVLNRVMIELEPGYGAKEAGRVASEVDGEVVFEFRTFPGFLIEFDGRTTRDLEQALAILQADRRVASAYPDLVLSASGQHDKNPEIETLLSPRAHSHSYLDAGMEGAWKTMRAVDNLDPVGIAMIDVDFLFPVTRNKIADTVLEREFNYDKISVRDAVFLSGEGFGPKRGVHGINVASVMVARNNKRDDAAIANGSFSGVVTSVDGLEYTLVVYKSGSNAAAFTAALEDIDQFKENVDVVNISLGIRCVTHSEFCEGGKHAVERRWLQLMAGMPSVTFVFGAGNDGEDADTVVPARMSQQLANAITVGSTQGYYRSRFSNYGDPVTMATPASGVWVVEPEVGNGYADAQGTSFAAPMVSGTVALLRAVDSGLSPEEIQNILVDVGESHSMCPSPSVQRDCSYSRKRWETLDAGAAVNKLLSIGSEIREQAVRPTEALLGSYVELSIPVENNGFRTRNFHMTGVAVSPSGTIKELGPAENVVQAGGTHRFKLGFWANEVGQWDIGCEIFGDSERDTLFDSKQLRIRIYSSASQPAAAESSVSVAVALPPDVPSTPAGVLRADANVLVLADTSGSMEGEKITKLRSAVLEFVSRVDDPGEYIGLIDFDDDVEEVIPLGPFGTGLGPWNDAVEQLDGDGGTALFDAVAHAVTVLEGQGAPDRTNIIIALTDGNDQDSLQTADEVISELQGASVPVILYALAYGEDAASGSDYDLEVLERLAEATGGVAYPATPEDLERLFTLLSTLF